MHGWTVPAPGLASNRLDFRQSGLLSALEQAVSGPTGPVADAGSNLAALITDERAFVGQRSRGVFDLLNCAVPPPMLKRERGLRSAVVEKHKSCIAVAMLCSGFAVATSHQFVRSLTSTTSSRSERKPRSCVKRRVRVAQNTDRSVDQASKCSRTLQTATLLEGPDPQSSVVSAFIVPAWRMLPEGDGRRSDGRSEGGDTTYEAHLIRNHAAAPRH